MESDSAVVLVRRLFISPLSHARLPHFLYYTHPCLASRVPPRPFLLVQWTERKTRDDRNRRHLHAAEANISKYPRRLLCNQLPSDWLMTIASRRSSFVTRFESRSTWLNSTDVTADESLCGNV